MGLLNWLERNLIAYKNLLQSETLVAREKTDLYWYCTSMLTMFGPLYMDSERAMRIRER